MKQQILDILGDLVACDTQNPPREICATSDVFRIVRERLGDQFRYDVQDFGKGRVNLLAKRGQPGRLFNVHLDTVPTGNGWTRPALQLTVENKRAYGRGVCDIKGAAACLIAAASSTTSDVAILFSSDEEGAESCCIQEFCASELASPFEEFVVSEPTGGLAVVGHRGYLSVKMTFQGVSGHTSQYQLLNASANHQAAHWTSAALTRIGQFEASVLSGQSACFNIGRMDGGIKNNMVADQCLVTWSARMPAGYSNQTLLDEVMRTVPSCVSWETTFNGAPLPGDLDLRQRTQRRCTQLSLETASDVDFWTEAAIFAATNKPTMVLGPGDIAQAHTADEWVTIQQLETCAETYLKLMNGVPEPQNGV